MVFCEKVCWKVEGKAAPEIIPIAPGVILTWGRMTCFKSAALLLCYILKLLFSTSLISIDVGSCARDWVELSIAPRPSLLPSFVATDLFIQLRLKFVLFFVLVMGLLGDEFCFWIGANSLWLLLEVDSLKSFAGTCLRLFSGQLCSVSPL